MKQCVKERLNKKLSDNNMTLLDVKPTQQRLYRNKVSNNEYQNRSIDNTDNTNTPYDNGLYDERLYDDRLYNRQYDDRQYNDKLQLSGYLTLQEPIEPTFWKSLAAGNEQLMIIILAGLATYTLYVLSKSKDKRSP